MLLVRGECEVFCVPKLACITFLRVVWGCSFSTMTFPVHNEQIRRSSRISSRCIQMAFKNCAFSLCLCGKLLEFHTYLVVFRIPLPPARLWVACPWSWFFQSHICNNLINSKPVLDDHIPFSHSVVNTLINVLTGRSTLQKMFPNWFPSFSMSWQIFLLCCSNILVVASGIHKRSTYK